MLSPMETPVSTVQHPSKPRAGRSRALPSLPQVQGWCAACTLVGTALQLPEHYGVNGTVEGI